MSSTPGDDDPGVDRRRPPPKRPREADIEPAPVDNVGEMHNYKHFTKPGYKRVFPENSISSEYQVFLESTKGEKVGNKNPLMMATLFKNDIKGVINIKRINENKLAVTFLQAINANNFLKNEQFLDKYDFKAYIPARAVERIGVLRYVPTNISNEELFKKLSSDYEIISVRRFTKRVNGEIKAMSSVSVTFLANCLPEAVYLDIFRFRVYEYVAPLLQCYKCFKFNHGAKICKSTQKCSICASEHHYSACHPDAVVKCINCNGPHLAISRDCPVKKEKMLAKQNVTSYANAVTSKPKNTNPIKNYVNEFPTLPPTKTTNTPTTTTTKPPMTIESTKHKKSNNHESKNIAKKKLSTEQLIEQIMMNDTVINGMVGALVTLGNDDRKITYSVIKDTLLNKLQNG